MEYSGEPEADKMAWDKYEVSILNLLLELANKRCKVEMTPSMLARLLLLDQRVVVGVLRWTHCYEDVDSVLRVALEAAMVTPTAVSPLTGPNVSSKGQLRVLLSTRC